MQYPFPIADGVHFTVLFSRVHSSAQLLYAQCHESTNSKWKPYGTYRKVCL